MDDTNNKNPYRCLPLNMANLHGWEVRCRCRIEALWNGGKAQDDLIVKVFGDDKSIVVSHFGNGILTFRLKAIFELEKGYNLWVSGPPNHFKNGIQPMSALVEADWMPYTFSISYKFTQANLKVIFEPDEPFCFIFPVPRGLIERFSPKIEKIDQESKLAKQLGIGRNKRKLGRVVKELKNRFIPKVNYQRWYQKGEMPDGSSGCSEHQTTLKLKPFKKVHSVIITSE